jgi:Na+/H+-dicarboxylate symporter
MKLLKYPLYTKLLTGLLLDVCRSVVNVTGDASCTVVVASTEGQL